MGKHRLERSRIARPGKISIFASSWCVRVVRKNMINLSKAAYEGLGKPDAVEIYIGGGKAALKPGDSFKFATVQPGRQNLYRISGVTMVRQVKEQVGEGRVMGRIVDGILVVG